MYFQQSYYIFIDSNENEWSAVLTCPIKNFHNGNDKNITFLSLAENKMYTLGPINVPYCILLCNSSTHHTSAFLLTLENYSRTNWYSCLIYCLFARCLKRQLLLRNATISFSEQWFELVFFFLVKYSKCKKN